MENEPSKSRTSPASESFKMKALSSKATATDHDDEMDSGDSSQGVLVSQETTYRVSVDDAKPSVRSPGNKNLNFDGHRKVQHSAQHRDTSPQ